MPWMPEVFTAPIAEARRAEVDAPTNDAISYYEGILADILIRGIWRRTLYNKAQVRPTIPERLRSILEGV